MPKLKSPPDPTALRRVEAGTYRSGDERFTVQQASGRWLLTDESQHDDLGLPLVRGPFATLDDARAAIEAARTAPSPTSDLRQREASLTRARKPAAGVTAKRQAKARPSVDPGRPRQPEPRQREFRQREPEPVELRRFRPGDGPAMRALWAAVGMESTGDDDDGLALLANRNPGLVLVATQGKELVGTALGAWDGRRGWIYHLAVAQAQRRTGLGSRLVHEVERKLRALGCPRVNVVVREGNDPGTAFWRAAGYEPRSSRMLGRDL